MQCEAGPPMIDSTFKKYSEYYDLLYLNKDYQGEASYIDTKLRLHSPRVKRVLELGCGTGRHAGILAKNGYTVHGIDASEEMISRAIHVPGFTCERADIRSVRLGAEYEAVLALFHVLNYMPDSAAIRSVFETANCHLKIGGLFCFDSWYSECVNHLRPETRVRAVSNDKVTVTRIAEPVVLSEYNVVQIKYTFFICTKATNELSTFTELHTVRHFSVPELELFGCLHGFELVNCEEFLTGRPLDLNTWGAFFVFRKIK